ncbi:MAG: hypothetical protein ACQKBU_12005 [Verrucomicrobiales bacterium]
MFYLPKALKKRPATPFTSPLEAHIGSPCRAIAPIHPVRESYDRTAKVFLEAMKSGRSISLFYLGGSSPGSLRRFFPESLYRLEPGGPIFATGICQRRKATRTLRLDRVRLA